jgi:hypothetical protein
MLPANISKWPRLPKRLAPSAYIQGHGSLALPVVKLGSHLSCLHTYNLAPILSSELGIISGFHAKPFAASG